MTKSLVAPRDAKPHRNSRPRLGWRLVIWRRTSEQATLTGCQCRSVAVRRQRNTTPFLISRNRTWHNYRLSTANL